MVAVKDVDIWTTQGNTYTTE